MTEDSVGREVSDLAKCTRRLALIAAPSARFPSSRPRAGLFTAGTAGKNTEDIKGSINSSR